VVKIFTALQKHVVKFLLNLLGKHFLKIIIYSVGGGNESLNISTNLIRAIKYAKSLKSNVISIVGKNDGYAYENSDCSILVSSDDKLFLTPISESMQVVIWHLLVSHPDLKINHTKW
tara:strand:- start:856 stop:1206 length:351 start_codon:yes stop_codon:yes gene_type:complete